MELALRDGETQFDATLVFMAVAGEEQGLLGSTHLAKAAKDAGSTSQGMFTNDIVGNTRGDDGTRDRAQRAALRRGRAGERGRCRRDARRAALGGENDSPPRQLARFIKESAERYVPDFKVTVICRRDRYLRGGDHFPFLEQGYPAVRFTEPSEDFATSTRTCASRWRAVRRPAGVRGFRVRRRTWRA